MMTDCLPLRYGLYAISTLPGLSRLNDNMHYFSQVFIGWTLAYLAARIVDIADQEKCCPPINVGIYPIKKGAKLYASIEF